MNKRYFIIAVFLLGAVLSMGTWFYLSEFRIGRDVVHLTNGTMIEADRVWRRAEMVHYEQNGEVRLVRGEDVTAVVPNGKSDIIRGWKNFQYLSAIVRQNLEKRTGIAPHFFDATLTGVGLVLKALIFILAASALFGGVKRLLPKKRSMAHGDEDSEDAVPEAAGGDPAEALSAARFQSVSPVDEIDGILMLFLNIFKIQCGAIREAPARYAPAENQDPGPNWVYELRVLVKDRWKSRRMSIGPLGEESGSNSKCFYVIYDSHMVIKIPRTPVTRFDVYIRSILKQRDVVGILRPWECIVPRVSVILEKVYTHSEGSDDDPEHREERWIKRISKNTIFQNYLKIGESFAYFMDLAAHHFLGQIIREIHDLQSKIGREINDHFELIWDHPGFVGRYGVAAESVCSHIQHIYSDYDEKIRILLGRYDISGTHPFHIKSWFLTHLNGGVIEPREIGLDSELVLRLNGFIAGIMTRNKDDIETLNDIIRQYVRKESFAHNRRVIKHLATKILRLIDGLAEKEISMRDLKPDNLLLIGDPHMYPEFLQFPDQFTLGIIDVETAVSLDGVEDGDIPQPMLGGTPLYATPAHFMNNSLLTEIFGDLPLQFRLQDWFAAVGIIFKLVTGRALFRKTAALFPAIIKMVQHPENGPRRLHDAVAKANRIFWRSAVKEFQTETAVWAAELEDISIPISTEMADTFIKYLEAEATEHARAIRRLIVSQTVYRSDEKRQYLMQSEWKIILKLKERWEQDMETAVLRPQARSRAIGFLSSLAWLKQEETRLKRNLEALRTPERETVVLDVLSCLFGRVRRFMYPETLEQIVRENPLTSANGADEAFYEATI